MNENLRPARTIAPGRIILRELEARGWSQQDLASIIDRPEQTISEIIRGKKQVVAETARQLAQAFGTTPNFWLNLEMNYRLQLVEKQQEENEIIQRRRFFELAPVNELLKHGWIKMPASTNELEQSLCRFLQISSIMDSPETAASYRISIERGPEERAQIAWIKRVEHLAAEQPISSQGYNIGELIQNLLALTQDPEHIALVPKALLDHGIHFVIVPHLLKTYLDGAVTWVNAEPVIALSLRYDRIDAFWFTLLHELAHIYLGHTQSHLDENIGQNRGEQSQEETEANRTASHWLVDENELDDFIEWNRPRYSKKSIEAFADQHHRHPGIIVGQLMFRNEIKYSHLREYLVRISPFLKKWVDVPFPDYSS